MSFLFKDRKDNNGLERTQFSEKLNGNRVILRTATLRILNTVIIYNAEEDYYETLATCVNENNVIETISIEGFDIHENVININNSYIDYEEYEEEYKDEYKENSEVNCTGTIYYL